MKKRIKFFKKFIKSHRTIGSITPSSKWLSKAMAATVNDQEIIKIAELGPGFGNLTNSIVEKNPVLVEIDDEFCEYLKEKFPRLEVKNKCATDFLVNNEDELGLVLSIPMINNPVCSQIVKAIGDAYQSGKVKWCVAYTYGTHSPLENVPFKVKKMERLVRLNIPPAFIWVYK